MERKQKQSNSELGNLTGLEVLKAKLAISDLFGKHFGFDEQRASSLANDAQIVLGQPPNATSLQDSK